MPVFIISILIQVVLVIHVVKTGRNTTWIWIIVMLPLAGSVAYFFLEILPELTSSAAGRSVGKKIQTVVNPNKGINAAVKNFSQIDSVENSMRLADECMKKGLYSDANELYVKCLSGAYETDPNIMFGLARAKFHLGEFQSSKEIMDDLIKHNPDYKNQEAHLLYARTIAELGEVANALHEYETLNDYFVGPDATFYFAMFLKDNNQQEKAAELLNKILYKAKESGRHYSKLHEEIIRRVKVELNNISR